MIAKTGLPNALPRTPKSLRDPAIIQLITQYKTRISTISSFQRAGMNLGTLGQLLEIHSTIGWRPGWFGRPTYQGWLDLYKKLGQMGINRDNMLPNLMRLAKDFCEIRLIKDQKGKIVNNAPIIPGASYAGLRMAAKKPYPSAVDMAEYVFCYLLMSEMKDTTLAGREDIAYHMDTEGQSHLKDFNEPNYQPSPRFREDILRSLQKLKRYSA